MKNRPYSNILADIYKAILDGNYKDNKNFNVFISSDYKDDRLVDSSYKDINIHTIFSDNIQGDTIYIFPNTKKMNNSSTKSNTHTQYGINPIDKMLAVELVDQEVNNLNKEIDDLANLMNQLQLQMETMSDRLNNLYYIKYLLINMQEGDYENGKQRHYFE